MVTVPSPWRTAFSSRLPSTWSILSGSAHRSGSGPADAQQEPVGGLAGGDVRLDVPSDGGADVDGLAAHLEPAGVDPGDVEQLGDEPGDPVGVGVDGLQHQPLLVVGEPLPLGEQGGGEALDGGERRAQLMGDGGDQLGVAALGAAAGLGVRAGRRRARRTGPGGVRRGRSARRRAPRARRAAAGCARAVRRGWRARRTGRSAATSGGPPGPPAAGPARGGARGRRRRARR